MIILETPVPNERVAGLGGAHWEAGGPTQGPQQLMRSPAQREDARVAKYLEKHQFLDIRITMWDSA